MFPVGINLIQAAAAGVLQDILLRTRSIGPFIANVTLEESHTDELSITDHPVERGGVISDHAYSRPAMVSIRVGYSNSNLQSLGNPNYVNQIYQQFLELQRSKELITIMTGKRFYENMLIQRLHTLTDNTTENSLVMMCDCRELQVVDTQVASFPNASVQASPESTAATQNRGSITLQPATGFNTTAAGMSLTTADGYSFTEAQ